MGSILRDELQAIGYGLQSKSQIVSPEPGSEKLVMAYRNGMEKNQIIGAVFCPPATPKNRACLRLSLHSKVTLDDVNYVVEICRALYESQQAEYWKSTRRYMG